MDIQSFLRAQINGGFGVREIARAAGLPASTISRIANGVVCPNMETCDKILKPFGYTIEIQKINRS